MRVSTWELYQRTICPKRALESPVLLAEEFSPARDLVKRVFLLRAIGRETGWTRKGIARVWDELFWSGKEINRLNMDASVKGLLAARALYKNLPKEGFSVHSTSSISQMLDTSIELSSAGDFILSYPDRNEIWIYQRASHKQGRRSVLPQLEHFLLQKKIKDDKPFYLVFYFTSTNRRTPIHFRIRDDYSIEANEKLAFSLCRQAKKQISYPVYGTQCDHCGVNC